VPNDSLENAANLKLEFSANSMKLHLLNGKEVTTLISQEGMMEGIYNLNEGSQMFRNGIHNIDNVGEIFHNFFICKHFAISAISSASGLRPWMQRS
jgi:hypothetical protein